VEVVETAIIEKTMKEMFQLFNLCLVARGCVAADTAAPRGEGVAGLWRDGAGHNALELLHA
jgi:hypothetical protein